MIVSMIDRAAYRRPPPFTDRLYIHRANFWHPSLGYYRTLYASRRERQKAPPRQMHILHSCHTAYTLLGLKTQDFLLIEPIVVYAFKAPAV